MHIIWVLKGKSLSIICSSLTWLNKHAKRASLVHVDATRSELRAQRKDGKDILFNDFNKESLFFVLFSKCI